MESPVKSVLFQAVADQKKLEKIQNTSSSTATTKGEEDDNVDSASTTAFSSKSTVELGSSSSKSSSTSGGGEDAESVSTTSGIFGPAMPTDHIPKAVGIKKAQFGINTPSTKKDPSPTDSSTTASTKKTSTSPATTKKSEAAKKPKEDASAFAIGDVVILKIEYKEKFALELHEGLVGRVVDLREGTKNVGIQRWNPETMEGVAEEVLK